MFEGHHEETKNYHGLTINVGDLDHTLVLSPFHQHQNLGTGMVQDLLHFNPRRAMYQKPTIHEFHHCIFSGRGTVIQFASDHLDHHSIYNIPMI
jgi:hypothetical protein